jgi:hypothetical protein
MRTIGIAGILAALAAGAAMAHHSPAVFDLTKEVKVVGTVKEFRWSNPHSFIELNVPNGKGGMDPWAIEMNPPSLLVKAGWKSTTLSAGMAVTVVVNPLRTDDKIGKFVSIKLPDGKELTEKALAP